MTGRGVTAMKSTDLIALLVEKAGAQVLPFDFNVRFAVSDADALSEAT
jgi:hypothetical protein